NGIIGFAAAAMVLVGIYLLFSDIVKKNTWSVALIAAVIAWIGAESAALLDADPIHEYLWNTIKYSGIAFMGPAWFGVASRFAAKSSWVGPKGTAILILSSSFLAFAVMTEPLHGLLAVGLPSAGGGRIGHAGPLWYLLMIFLYSFVISGLILVGRGVARFPPITKRRGYVLMLAVLLPTVFASMDLLPPQVFSGFRFAPLALVFSSAVLFYGFIRLRLAAPLGLARETVIDMSTDPIIVIDESMRIASANPAARAISQNSIAALPGVRLDDAFPGLERIVTAEGRAIDAKWAGDGREYLVRATLVEDPRSASRAVIATLSDVTRLMDEQERLERIVDERTFLLKQTNAELETTIQKHEEAERRLHEALSEKEMLMKEIHHRVKNNLQIVSSLINLQSNRIFGDEAQAAYSDLKSRIRSISLVHERIYQSSTFTKTELGAYVHDLVFLIASSVADRDVPIKVEIPEEKIDVDPNSCVDIGLLLNELIVNAVKYGRSPARNEAITVRLRRSGGFIEFEVRDTGPGFASAAPDKGDSLGMKIIRATAGKYRAEVSFKNDNGAVVTVRIPADRIVQEEVVK
ncbi:MAG: histidine kinase N-terminal 7TM domain-containing protein, partial [Treponemataceae bacterium]